MRAALVSLFVFTACDVSGQGALLDPSDLSGSVGQPLTVPFEVALYCDGNGPMRQVDEVTAQVTAPDGSVESLSPSFTVDERPGVVCTEGLVGFSANVLVPLTPTAPGLHVVQIDIAPVTVGRFKRNVTVSP